MNNSRYNPLNCFFNVITETKNGIRKVYGNSVNLCGNAVSIFKEMKKLESTEKWLTNGEKVVYLHDTTLNIKYSRESLENA